MHMSEQQPADAPSGQGATPYEDHDFGGEGAPTDIPDHVEPYSSRDDGGDKMADTAPFTERIDPIESAPSAPDEPAG